MFNNFLPSILAAICLFTECPSNMNLLSEENFVLLGICKYHLFIKVTAVKLNWYLSRRFSLMVCKNQETGTSHISQNPRLQRNFVRTLFTVFGHCSVSASP